MDSIKALLLVVVLLMGIALPEECLSDADDIYREYGPAVVVVIAVDDLGRPMGQGSGFIARSDGAMVTNYHVISMASDVRVKRGSKGEKVEGVIYADPENDLAIIKLEGKNFPAVKLGDADKVRVGERIYVIGSPRGLENTISEGIISGIREVNGTRKILQMTASISPGSSGGPVFNEKGEVVGVATFLIEETQNLNFAMPVNPVIEGLLRKELVKLREACRVDFKKTAACWYYQGLAWGSAGDYDRASDAFRRSLAIDPQRIETYANLGVDYARAGKYDQAIEMLTMALKIDPDRAEVLALLGAVYSQTGKYQKALEALTKAITLEPNARNYYNLAVLYGRMKLQGEAIKAAETATRLDPNYAEAHGFLATEYVALKMHREAVNEYKAGIRIKPDDPAMHLGLGSTYVLMGDRASALEEYKILKRMESPSADALFDLIYK
jgi:tetratricopeptide (TPR) repeat protein